MATESDRAARPDPLQIGAATALIALAAVPLMFYLHAAVGLFVGLLLVMRFAVLARPAMAPGRWLLAALALLGVAVVLASYRELAGQDAGTALLLSMMALKTLEMHSLRDLRVSLLLFGFLLVVSFLFNQSPIMVAYLAVLLLGSFALLADLSAAGVAEARHLRWRERSRAALRPALVLSAQALPFALLLFVLFPRLDAPLWNLGLDRERAKTGVSDSLELGRFGELVRSGAVAFHAYFDEPLPVPADQLYWRGPVLWETDGRGWRSGEVAFMAKRPPDIQPLGELLDYAIVMEPTEQRWIFALDVPVVAPAQSTLTRDARLLAKAPIQELERYQLRSALSYRLGKLTEATRERALQLPEQMVTPRMRRLVAEWQAQGASPQTLVARALAHFNQEPFHYTLNPPPLGDNPVDDFLFETRAGYCEHYASSFAQLMRLAGVPARLVVGYLGAEFNPLGGHYLVRQSDAHAWAEVWLEETGWTRVDPTAAVAPERIDDDQGLADLGGTGPLRFRVSSDSGLGRLTHRLRLLLDAADAGWKSWVVGFSSNRQRRLLEALGLEHLGRYGLVLGLASGGVILMLALHALLARPARPEDPVARSYVRLCQRLARAGLPRRAHEGPRDYLTRVAKARPDLSHPLRVWLQLYLPLRFGEKDSAQARRALILREKKMSIRHSTRAPGGKSVED